MFDIILLMSISRYNKIRKSLHVNKRLLRISWHRKLRRHKMYQLNSLSDYIVTFTLLFFFIVLVFVAGRDVGIFTFASNKNNLVENASFENDSYKYTTKLGMRCPGTDSTDDSQIDGVYDCDYGEVASGWQVVGSRYLYQRYKVDDSVKTDRSVSQLVDVNGVDMGIKQVVSLQANKTYMFSADILLKNGGVSFVAESAEDNSKIIGYSETRDKDNEWQNLSFIINTSDNDQRVNLKIVGLESKHNLFNVDNVTVIEDKHQNVSEFSLLQCGTENVDDTNGTRKTAIEIQKALDNVAGGKKVDDAPLLPDEYYPISPIGYKKFKVFLYIPKELNDKSDYMAGVIQKTVDDSVKFYDENDIKLIQDGGVEVIESNFSFVDCDPNGDYFKDECKDLMEKFAKKAENKAMLLAAGYRSSDTIPVIVSPTSNSPRAVGSYNTSVAKLYASIIIYGPSAPGSGILGNQFYDPTDSFHTLAHEFGHALGLNHSFMPSIMGSYFGDNILYTLFDNMYYPEKYVACNAPLNRNNHQTCDSFVKPIPDSMKEEEVAGNLACSGSLKKTQFNGYINLVPIFNHSRERIIQIPVNNNKFDSVEILDFGNELYRLDIFDSNSSRYIQYMPDGEPHLVYTFVNNYLDRSNPFVCLEYGYNCMPLKDWEIPFFDSNYCNQDIYIDHLKGKITCDNDSFNKFKDPISIVALDRNSKKISEKSYLNNGHFDITLKEPVRNLEDFPINISLHYQVDTLLNRYAISLESGSFNVWSHRTRYLYHSDSLNDLVLPLEVCNKLAVIEGTLSCKKKDGSLQPIKHADIHLYGDIDSRYLSSVSTDDNGLFSMDNLYFNWGNNNYMLRMQGNLDPSTYTFRLSHNNLIFNNTQGDKSNIVSGNTYSLASDGFLKYSPNIDIVMNSCQPELFEGQTVLSGKLKCGALNKIKFDRDIIVSLYDNGWHQLTTSIVNENGEYSLSINDQLSRNSYPLHFNILYGADIVDSFDTYLYDNGLIGIFDPIQNDRYLTLMKDFNSLNPPFYSCPFIAPIDGSAYCIDDSNKKIEIPLNNVKLYNESNGINHYAGDAKIVDNKFESNDLYRQREPSQAGYFRYKMYIETNNGIHGTVDLNLDSNSQTIEYINIPNYMNINNSKVRVALDNGVMRYTPSSDVVFNSCDPSINDQNILLGGHIKCPNSTILLPFDPQPNGYANVEFKQLIIDPPLDNIAKSENIYQISEGYFTGFPINVMVGSMQDTLQFKLYNNYGGLANFGKDIYYFKYNDDDGTVTLTNTETKEAKTFPHDDIQVELSSCDTSLTCTEEQSLGNKILNTVSFGILGDKQCEEDSNSTPVVNFSVDKSTVYKAVDQAKLVWNSTNVSGCYATGEWSGRKDTSGYEIVGPFTSVGNKTYTINCFDVNNKVVSKSLTISVLERSATIKGTVTCQYEGNELDGDWIVLHDSNQREYRSNTFSVSNNERENVTRTFSIDAQGVNLYDGGIYNIKPASGHSEHGLQFDPNGGGTYECIQKNPYGDGLIVKRNTNDQETCVVPDFINWCGDIGTSGPCWQQFDPSNVVITSTSCSEHPPEHQPWEDICNIDNQHGNWFNKSPGNIFYTETDVVGDDGNSYFRICFDKRRPGGASWEEILASEGNGFLIYVDRPIDWKVDDGDKGKAQNPDFVTGRKGQMDVGDYDSFETPDTPNGPDVFCTKLNETNDAQHSITMDEIRSKDNDGDGKVNVILFPDNDGNKNQNKTCNNKGSYISVGLGGVICERKITNVKAVLNQNVIPLSNTTINLNWDYSYTGPDSKLTIKRIDDHGDEITLATNIDKDVKNYTDTNIESNKEYTYKIIPDNTVGNCTKGLDVQIGTSNVVKVHSPVGFTGNVEGGTICKVKGWALDKDVLSAPVNINVYADKTNLDGGELVGTAKADVYRRDLENLFGLSNGEHGFEIELDNEKLTTGCHLLYVYADNLVGTKGDVSFMHKNNTDNVNGCSSGSLPEGWQSASGVIECEHNQCVKEISNAKLQFYSDATQVFDKQPGGFARVSWDGPRDVALHIYKRNTVGPFIFDELVYTIPENYIYNNNTYSDVYINSGDISYVVRPVNKRTQECPDGYSIKSGITNSVKVYSPEGYTVKVGAYSQCSIEGLAVDQDVLDESAKVRIYKDAPYDQGGILIKTISADKFSPDMAKADEGFGNHNFSTMLDEIKDGQCHPLYLYVVNKEGTLGKPLVQLNRKDDTYTNGCYSEYPDWQHIPIEWQGASVVLHCNR